MTKNELNVLIQNKKYWYIFQNSIKIKYKL